MIKGSDLISDSRRRELASPKTHRDPLSVQPPRATLASQITREMTMRTNKDEEAREKKRAVKEGTRAYKEYQKEKAERERQDAAMARKYREGELREAKYQEQKRMEELSERKGMGKDVMLLTSLGTSSKGSASAGGLGGGNSSGQAGILLMPGGGDGDTDMRERASSPDLHRASSTRIASQEDLRFIRDEHLHKTYCIIFDTHHARWLLRVSQATTLVQVFVTLAVVSAVLSGPHRSSLQTATILMAVFEVLAPPLLRNRSVPKLSPPPASSSRSSSHDKPKNSTPQTPKPQSPNSRLQTARRRR